MQNRHDESQTYRAKVVYRDGSPVGEYEKQRFSGLLGRYRNHREQTAISTLVDMLPEGISIADCPCGNGRWWPVLARRASRIVAIDVSAGMLRYAREQIKEIDVDVAVVQGDAENVPLRDATVDYVFSHALTKHLPIPVQYKVLAEFSRIAISGIICSFGVFSHLTYELWKRRHLDESYPILPEQLQAIAEAANLRIRTMRKCTTLVGVEHTVFFEKLN